MATYFISDIHGEYELFCRLLDKIKFDDGDTMLILGDFIEKGKDSFKLTKLIYNMPNIDALAGNHEYYFAAYFHSLMHRSDINGNADDTVKVLQKYFHGESGRITWELADYIAGLPDHIEADEYICVHAGVELDGSGRVIPIYMQNPKFFVFDRSLADERIIPKYSKTILFGHTPCHYSNGTGHIIKIPRQGREVSSRMIGDFAKIRLDNGVDYTGMLGCLRLEGMEEFYVFK